MLAGRSVLNSDCSNNVKGSRGPLCLGDTQSQGRETDRENRSVWGGGGLRKRREGV